MVNNNTTKAETNDAKHKKLMLITLGVFVIIFILWGSIAKLASATHAVGVITSAHNNQVVQHLEGGIVEKIFVKDGELVKAGQILLTLDSTKNITELNSVEAKYYEQLALANRLTAEKNAQKEIVFDKEFDNNISSELKQMHMQAQIYEFKMRLAEFNAKMQVLDERQAQLQNQYNGISAEISAKQELALTYTKQIQELQKLYYEQLVDKLKLTEEQRHKITVDGDIASLTAERAKVGAQIAEVKAQRLDARQEFLKDVASALTLAQTQVADLQDRVFHLRKQLERTEILAPVAGYVVGLSVNTIGAVIPSGQKILDIVPKDEPLIAECMVNPVDIHYVHPNLKVKLTFPSFSHIKTLKDVDGEVTDVSADVYKNEKDDSSYYKVKIKINNDGVKELTNNNLALTPGMPVDAMILTGERTLLQYLMQPFENMFKKGMKEQ